MSVIIRQATTKDVQEICNIVNIEISTSTSIYDYSERTYDQQLTWFQTKKLDQMPVVVAEMNNQVVGFGTYGIFRPKAAYQYSVEHSIYTHADFRGMGIGKRLLAELISCAKDNGIHTMIAGIDATNESSIAFHKNFGFVEVGRCKEVGYKFDRWLDLVFLQLML